MEAPAPRIDELLRKAIELKRLIRFTYKDKPRIVEPHDIGVTKVPSNFSAISRRCEQ
jgi:hypothetical protein